VFGESGYLFDAYAVVQTYDGGYAIAGVRRAATNPPGPNDFWFVKTDPDGFEQFSQYYDFGGEEVATSLVQCSDRGFALAGYSNSFSVSNDALLIRINAFGDMMWSNHYGGGSPDQVNSIVRTADGGFAMAGSTSSYGGGDAWLIKVDNNGDPELDPASTHYGNPASFEYASSIVVARDGGFALACSSGGLPYILKISADGTAEWTQNFPVTGSDTANAIAQTGDGSYIMAGRAGTTASDAFLVKTEPESYTPIEYSITQGTTISNFPVELVQGDVPAETFYNYIPYSIETTTHLTIVPDTIGVGQTLQGLIQVEPAPPEGQAFHGLRVQVWGPNETYQTLGPYTTTVGAYASVSFNFQPTQTGYYYFYVSYPGESYANGTTYSGYENWMEPVTILSQYDPVTLPSPPEANPLPPPVLEGGSGHLPVPFSLFPSSSLMYLYEDPAGQISLIMQHGADSESSPAATVEFDITGLPFNSHVGDYWLVKDDPGEVNLGAGNHELTALWNKEAYGTDGGVISGLAGAWDITVNPIQMTGLSDWQFIIGPQSDGLDYVALDQSQPITISAHYQATSGGIAVQNIVEGVPPDSPWSYTINDTLGNIVQSFTLPAGGSTSFPSLGAGNYLVAETTKFGYTTSMTINGAVVDNSQATVYLAPGDVASVSFINSAMPAFATQYLGQAPPSDLNVQLPALKPIPVQSAWSVDISGNTIPDLVLGKPMAVLVNLAGVSLQSTDQVTVSVAFEGTTYPKTFNAVDLGIGAIVGFSPIVPGSTGTKYITGSYQINSGTPIALTPTSVTVKTTNSLSLYFAYLSAPSKYGSEDQAAFDMMAQNSVAFLNATYPIKNATVNIVYSGKSITGSTKSGTTAMQADAVAVAAKAKSVMGTGAVGVAIGPNNTGLSDYFASLGKAGAAGVSFGPSTKGVVVLDGYYTAAAHEVAHTYGLYWGVPEQYQTNPPNGKTASGVWPTNGQWRTGYSFMGTAPYRTLGFSWVDDAATYRYLFNHTATNVADPEIVVVSGLIYKTTGEVDFVSGVPWYHFNQGTADTVPAGDYALKFLDASGNTLKITSFEADFFMQIDPGTSVGADQVDTSTYGMVPLDAASFVFAAEYPTGTATIQVIDVTKPETPLKVVTADELVQVGNSVTFTENGLPTGKSWSVTFGGLTQSSTTNTITFTGVSTGSYSWNASTPISGGTGIRYVTSLSSGTMNVPTQASQNVAYTTQYQVSFCVSPLNAGTVSPSKTAYYDKGSKVSISATSSRGDKCDHGGDHGHSAYTFWNWTSSNPSISFASSTSASTTATINGPGTITANFAYSVSDNDDVELTGSNNVIIINGGNHIIDCRHATSTTVLKVGSGNNVIYLGGGDNIVKETAGGNDKITTGNGNNDINIIANGNYQITTGSGNDKIQITGNGNSIIKAGDGNNIVTISGNGNNQITTGNGKDVVVAGNGNNNIQTGAGDDNITVGTGNNYIDGGAGYDVCVHGNGHNTIVNCEKK
jgi:hypothetical protein